MNGFLESLSIWIVDFYALATVLLAISLLVRAFVQPAARVTLAWGTWLGIALIAVVAALPVWPRYAIDDIAYVSPPPAEAASLQQPEANLLPVETQVDIAVAAETPVPISDPLPTPVEAAAPTIETASGSSWRQLVTGLWLAAAALGCCWIVIGRARTRELLKRAKCVPTWVREELRCILQRAARNATEGVPYSAGERPGLWASSRVSSAVVLGAIRPQIILPQGSLCEANRPAIRAALAHEWAHIRHGDLWLLALERALLPLLAVHPFFWWLRRLVRLDQELLADAAAAGEERVEYAEALLAWAQSARPSRHGLAAIGMWENPNSLSRRVAMILDAKRPLNVHVNRAWAGALVALLAPVVVGLSLVTLRPAQAQDEAVEAVPAQPRPDEPAPRYRELPSPVPRASTVPVTKIQLDLLVLSVDRKQLAAAETTLEEAIAEATASRCRREAGLIVSDITPEEVVKLLEGLKKHEAVKVISQPKIMTLDGREAILHVGGEAPVLRVEETVNGKHEQRVEYKEFGTLLMVRPKLDANEKEELVRLDIVAEQSRLLPPGEKAEEGAVPRDVPGLVSHKFKLTEDVKLGGSLLVAESPAGKKQLRDAVKEQFLLVVTPQRAVREAAAVYASPTEGDKGEAARAATQAALEAATAAEPEPGTAAAALLKAERLARQKETTELKQQLDALQQELKKFRGQKPTTLDQQLFELDVAQARLTVDAAEKDWARIQQLRERNVISQQQVDEKQIALAQAKIELQKALTKLESVTNQATATTTAAPPAAGRGDFSQSTQVRLLELDAAEAKLAIEDAEARLAEAAQIRAKNPGAVSDQMYRTMQLAVERAKIQLQRVMIKLEAAREPRPQQGR